VGKYWRSEPSLSMQIIVLFKWTLVRGCVPCIFWDFINQIIKFIWHFSFLILDDDQYELDGRDLSFSSLLAAHGRRRSERSVSYSSCSWSDVSIGSETFPRKPLSINPAISKGLLVVAVEPRGREITFVEHYSSSHLMTLPPLFLACSRGRSTPVGLLLQYGAKATAQVSPRFLRFAFTCFLFPECAW
jgi:hypothetical protein